MSLPEVFTVLRMEDHRVPLFRLHVDRLFWGFRYARYPAPPTRKAIARALIRALRDLPAGHLRVRVRFGPDGIGTTWAPVEPAPSWSWRSADVVPFPHPAVPWKVGSWDRFWEAHEQARMRGHDEALLVRGEEVVSLARANVICLLDGSWCTPHARSGPVNGVMRRFVSRILKMKGKPLVFRSLTLQDLERAEVVAGTNAVRLFFPLAMGRGHNLPLRELWNMLESWYRKSAVKVR